MRIGIIGGGITGLCTAYYLSKQGIKVIVLEKEDELGGLLSSFRVKDVWVDRFYHCILGGDEDLIRLIKELGLGKRLYWTQTKMGCFYNGRLYPLSTPLELLRFQPLNLFDRFRLGLVMLYSGFLRNWEDLEGITAKDWLIKYGGRHAFEIFWRPLLTFKFGNNYHKISATWIWGRLARQKKTRGKWLRGELVGYLKGGFKCLIDRLEKGIKDNQGIISKNTEVKKIVVRDGKAIGVKSQNNLFELDGVISTIPLPLFLDIIPNPPMDYRSQIDRIGYQGVICLILRLKRRLTSFYWIPILESSVPFSGIVETTNLIPPQDIDNSHLIYLLNYVDRRDCLFHLSKDALFERSVSGLKNLFPTFSSNWIEDYFLFRAPYVEPISSIGYSKSKPSLYGPFESLYLANTSQLHPMVNCLNSCVRLSKLISETLLLNRN